MLIPLPLPYGTVVTHAVEPGYESLVEEAQARYTRAMKRAWFSAGAFSVGGIVACIALTFSLASYDTAVAREVMTFFVCASIVLGISLFPTVYFLSRSVARDHLINDVADHTLPALLLDFIYQSGEASNEQEWQAAKLVQKVREHDDEQCRLRSTVEKCQWLWLTPERQAEVARLNTRIQGLEKRSRRLRAEAAELLDPPVRRRHKKPTVVG